MSDTEVFTHERPGFAERLAKLAGTIGQMSVSTGGQTKHIPDAHALAASLAMARRGSRDIGPEIAAAIYCGTDLWRPRIVSELVSAWVQTVTAARAYPKVLPIVGGHAYMSAVYGDTFDALWAQNLGIKPAVYTMLVSLGTNMLLCAAEDCVARAARAYYRN